MGNLFNNLLILNSTKMKKSLIFRLKEEVLKRYHCKIIYLIYQIWLYLAIVMKLKRNLLLFEKYKIHKNYKPYLHEDGIYEFSCYFMNTLIKIRILLFIYSGFLTKKFG